MCRDISYNNFTSGPNECPRGSVWVSSYQIQLDLVLNFLHDILIYILLICFRNLVESLTSAASKSWDTSTLTDNHNLMHLEFNDSFGMFAEYIHVWSKSFHVLMQEIKASIFLNFMMAKVAIFVFEKIIVNFMHLSTFRELRAAHQLRWQGSKHLGWCNI